MHSFNHVLSPFNEAMRYNPDTTAIKDELLNLVNESMSKSSIRQKYKNLVNDFIANRTSSLYDNIPCDRILCSENEMDKLFTVLDIKKAKVTEIIGKTYYGDISNFNPLAAKHEFTITMLLVIRYFMMNKMDKECQLACLHLAFSGKFYPSLHYRSYPTVTPARHIMEFVVNNRLSKKFDLVVHGNVFGAIRSVSSTWLATYGDKMKSLTDEDCVYLVQQLHSRVGSFIKNIAEEYYAVYEDKDAYIAYTSDSLDADDFHMADNNTLKISKNTERAMNFINANGVNFKYCRMSSNTDITPNECRAVIESILMNRDNIGTIKELISLMIALYYSTGKQDLTDIEFITYTIAPKPNAKQKEIVRVKEIIEEWLCESGTAYMRRRSRIATKNSYERCVRMYFALAIHDSVR